MVLENIDIIGFVDWFGAIGGFDIILPFLLVFAITFAVLDKIKIFGPKARNINTVLAIIVAFFLLLQPQFIDVLQQFLPRVSMFLITIIMILLVMGMFGYGFGDSWQGLSVIVAIVGVVWALGASLDWNLPVFDLLNDQDIAILLILGIFILVIWFIVRDPNREGSGGAGVKDFLNKLGAKLPP